MGEIKYTGAVIQCENTKRYFEQFHPYEPGVFTDNIAKAFFFHTGGEIIVDNDLSSGSYFFLEIQSVLNSLHKGGFLRAHTIVMVEQTTTVEPIEQSNIVNKYVLSTFNSDHKTEFLTFHEQVGDGADARSDDMFSYQLGDFANAKRFDSELEAKEAGNTLVSGCLDTGVMEYSIIATATLKT